MNALAQRMRHFWAGRQDREKAFLIVLAAVVTVGLLAQMLWTSHQARARLRKQLPQLEQQVETLRRKAADLQQLKAQPSLAAPGEGSALLATAATAAKAVGLPEAAAKLQLEGVRRLRLRATVPFDRWLQWTAALQRDGQVRLVSCKVEAAATAGLVSVDALFALPDPL
jgi:type II secretory pathway component PulM